MSQGRTANRTGNALETAVASSLRSWGISFCPQFSPHGLYGVMGEAVVIDFYIPKAVGFEAGLYIECRWQDTTGSADKKTPCLADNITTKYDRPTVVVVDGRCSSGIRSYLEQRTGGRLRAVMSLAEFMSFSRSLSDGRGHSHIQKEYDPDQKRLFGG